GRAGISAVTVMPSSLRCRVTVPSRSWPAGRVWRGQRVGLFGGRCVRAEEVVRLGFAVGEVPLNQTYRPPDPFPVSPKSRIDYSAGHGWPRLSSIPRRDLSSRSAAESEADPAAAR